MIDLKQLREDANKTQQEMADYLGVSQPQYGRYEKDPASMPMSVFIRLAPFIDDMNHLLQSADGGNAKALDAGAPYGPLFRQRDQLLNHLLGLQPLESDDIPELFRFERLKEVIEKVVRKPNLAMMGRFDAGKTHLVNTLLGRNTFVTKYRPSTSLITIVKHVDDRPPEMLEAVEIRDAEDKCLMRGNIGLLNEFGVHRRDAGEDYERIRPLARTALVYLDAPILRSCNIIDVPGYQSIYEEDREKANSVTPMIDILLYLTPVVSGLDANDMIELSYLLRTLPAPEAAWKGMPLLSNWFLVFTHADPNRRSDDLNDLISNAAHDLIERFDDSVFRRRYTQPNAVTSELIKRRSFLFWSETPARRESLLSDLKQLLGELMPVVINQQTIQVVEALKSEGAEAFSKQVEKWRTLLMQREAARNTYEALLATSEARRAEYEAGRDRVKAVIVACADAAFAAYSDAYDALMSVEGLERFISDHYTDSKRAQAEGPSLLNEQLMLAIQQIIETNTKPVAEALEEFLLETSVTMQRVSSSGGIEIPLDMRAAFWAGVGSTVMGGGLAIAAASAGNLGGYILLSQGVGALSAIGVGFGVTGGSAGIMSAVAAIGGPVTIGVALTAMAGLATWRLLADSWQLRFAKKISKHYADNKMRDHIREIIERHFDSISKEFEAGLARLEEQYGRHVKILGEAREDALVREELEKKLQRAEKSARLLEGLGGRWGRDDFHEEN